MKTISKPHYFIGVMSGTSLDGIDIVLCDINAVECKLIYSCEYPFDTQVKDEILQAIDTCVTLKKIGILEYKLSTLYANSINSFLQKFQLQADSIQAIGLHGQTLWHEPNSDTPFSMQLGDANVVAAHTGIQTIADFRRMDIANGGQGAPFAPAFHQFLFSSFTKNTAVVNIGGMANITLLGKNLQGWDSGCGNVLLDSWINKTQGKAYDKDGVFAKSGSCHTSLLQKMLQDAYFQKSAPKSTGREYFNETWIEKKCQDFSHLSEADIQRTLLELTAQSIAHDLNKTAIEQAIICGGGTKNTFLMQRLKDLCTCNVLSSDSLGADSDFLEAMAFAWFAYKRVKNETVDLCSVTGAKKASLLGGIYG